jgi:hypothetical protein
MGSVGAWVREVVTGDGGPKEGRRISAGSRIRLELGEEGWVRLGHG